MGEEITRESFSARDRRRFAERCRDGLAALAALIDMRPTSRSWSA